MVPAFTTFPVVLIHFSSAVCISAAVWNRSSGFFSSALVTMRSSSSGRVFTTERTGGASSWMTACIVSYSFSRRKRALPVSVSQRQMPSAKTSERPSISFPRLCSGAM